jgi:hypothetical protein
MEPRGATERLFAACGIARRCERLAFDVLKDQVASTVLFFHAVDAGEVGVVELREGLGLALETLEPGRVGRQLRRQRLDRNLPIQPGVRGEVHHAHAATAELAGDVVRADAFGRQGQRPPLSSVLAQFWIRRMRFGKNASIASRTTSSDAWRAIRNRPSGPISHERSGMWISGSLPRRTAARGVRLEAGVGHRHRGRHDPAPRLGRIGSAGFVPGILLCER